MISVSSPVYALAAAVFWALAWTPFVAIAGDDTSYDYGECLESWQLFSALSPEDRSSRCTLLARLEARGLHFPGELAEKVIVETARPFGTVLELSGEISLNKRALDYLFSELPDTARLINHFGRSKYQVDYIVPDRSRFFATNGRSMQATFDIIDAYTTPARSNYLLFESGRAKLLFWKFSGNTVVEMDLTETAERTEYVVRIDIFTDSRAYKSFFESTLFKYLVGSLFRQVLSKVANAAVELQRTREEIDFTDPTFTENLFHHMQQTDPINGDQP